MNQPVSSEPVAATPGKKSKKGLELGPVTPLNRDKKQLKKVGRWLFVVWTILCLSVGVLAGWWVSDRLYASRVSEGPAVVEIPAAEDFPDFMMPDLRGLAFADAKQLLADSGVDLSTIDAVEVEWGGQPGVVITQDPVSGEEISGRIQLQVSKQATMPEVIGLSRLEATDALRALGAEAEIKERFDLSTRTGSVLESSVAAGDPLPSIVTLTVAQPGASVFLAQLKGVESNCSMDEGRINGQSYPNSLSCSAGKAERPQVSTWLLNRQVHQLTGVIGVDDRGKTGDTVQVIITGDGQELANVTASYATPAEINVSVQGVLRLEMTMISAESSRAILGDMMVKGLPDEIATLETR